MSGIYAPESSFNHFGGDQYNIHWQEPPAVSSHQEALLVALNAAERGHYYVPKCMPGTGQWIVNNIHTWLDDFDASNVLWLSGGEGSGKSAIISTVASNLQEVGRLGSYFFCKRDDDVLSDPTVIWRTVASDLARMRSDMAGRMAKNIRRGRVDPGRPDIDLHFKYLIEDPSKTCLERSWITLMGDGDEGESREEHLRWPVMGETVSVSTSQESLIPRFPVIVIDALDECGSELSQSAQRRALLDTIGRWATLHPCLKLVITSRTTPIPSIRNKCHHIPLTISGHANPMTELDIQFFFQQRLADIMATSSTMTLNEATSFPQWPSVAVLRWLTCCAAGSFKWSECVARFLEHGNAREKLEMMMNGQVEGVGENVLVIQHTIARCSYQNWENGSENSEKGQRRDEEAQEREKVGSNEGGHDIKGTPWRIYSLYKRFEHHLVAHKATVSRGAIDVDEKSSKTMSPSETYLEAITMAMDRIYTTAPQLHNQRVELRPPKLAAIEDAGRLEEMSLLDTGPNSQLYHSLSISESNTPMFPELETMGFVAEVHEVNEAERALSNDLDTFRFPQPRSCNEVNFMSDLEIVLQSSPTKSRSERSESAISDAKSTSAMSVRSYIPRAVNGSYPGDFDSVRTSTPQSPTDSLNNATFDNSSPPRSNPHPSQRENPKRLAGSGASQYSLNHANAEKKPWYLRSTYDEKDIIVDPDGMVRGGTINALVERLTTHEHDDPTFVKTFLMTFKSFTNLDELFELLVGRFGIQAPDSLSPLELKKWRELKQHVIQIRVINIFKSMVMDKDVLEKEDLYILDRMKAFMSKEEVIKFSAAKQLLVFLEHVHRPEDTKVKMTTSTTSQLPPSPIAPKSSKKLNLLDINPLELARQLTILESRLYQKIRPMECLRRSREYKSNYNDNIAIVIRTSNQIANWVAESVLSHEDFRRRATVVKQFISVADSCRSIHNFSSMVAIVSGLNLPHIRRLKQTWEQVNAQFMAQLSACEIAMDSNKNFINYRTILAKTSLPCVPFIGVFLTTLIFVQDGSKDDISGNLINFRKRQKVYEVIQDIRRWQSHPHTFHPVQNILTYIDDSLQVFNDHTETDEQLWNISLEREPRERDHGKMVRLLETTPPDTDPKSQMYLSLSISSTPMFPELESMGFMTEVQEVKKVEQEPNNDLDTFSFAQSGSRDVVQFLSRPNLPIPSTSFPSIHSRSQSLPDTLACVATDEGRKKIEKVMRSSVSEGKQKQKERDFDRMMDLIGKASEREMTDQIVLIEGGMNTRFERARQRDLAKKESFVNRLASHSKAGRLHAQDAVFDNSRMKDRMALSDFLYVSNHLRQDVVPLI